MVREILPIAKSMTIARRRFKSHKIIVMLPERDFKHLNDRTTAEAFQKLGTFQQSD